MTNDPGSVATAPREAVSLRLVQIVPHRIPGGMQRIADLLDEALPQYGICSSVVALGELTGSSGTGGARKAPMAVIRAWVRLHRHWRGRNKRGRKCNVPDINVPAGASADEASRPDAVVCHTVLGAVLGTTAARAASVPRRVLVVHIDRGGLGVIKTCLLWLLSQSGLLTDVVYCGKGVEATFSAVPGRLRRIGQAVQNGIPLPELNDVALAPLPGEPTTTAPAVVVVAARLVPEKNLDVIIEAVSRCRLPVQLRIYGDGALRSDLEERVDRLCAPAVFYGTVDRAELHEAYAEATAFLLPSIAEGLPLVLIEAAALGLPAIVSDRLFNREVLGSAGVYVSSDSPDAWAREIDALCADFDRRGRLRQAMRARVEHFGVERMARDYAALLIGVRS